MVTVIRGTVGDFASQLSQDVSGGYLKWLAAILVIGALGYVDTLKEPSRYLLGLVALVILLTNGAGFVSMFAQQIQNPGQATAATPAGGNANLPAIPIQSQGGGGGQSAGQQGGAGSTLGGIASAIGGQVGSSLIGSIL